MDDTLSAYRALLDTGLDPSTIAFAGDSAGGGLTVTTALAARDTGLPLPGAIVAFSPGFGLPGPTWPSPPDTASARPLPSPPDASVNSRQLPCQSTELMRHGRVAGPARG
ncbi:alpha/beta hydrolase fold domain-containing protein [Streptomyces sp. NBC_01343]|uniref:alpha/beta hydrolase fold domain-containing protein n=1 Tax=Streptomyces sp. NBC_01343 TaxID=2903832 RepID=UPI003FA3BE20